MISNICFFVIGLSVGLFFYRFSVAFYLQRFPLSICDYCKYYGEMKNRRKK